MGIDRNRFVRKQGESWSSPTVVLPTVAVAPEKPYMTPRVQEPMPVQSLAPDEPVIFTEQANDGVINLKEPDIARKPKKHRRANPVFVKYAAGTLGIVALFALSVAAGAYSNYRDTHKNKTPQVAGVSTTKAVTSSGITVTPADTADGLKQVVGQGLLTADDPFYQYTDTFEGGQVTISRQPLPDNYKTDPNALQTFANQLHANQTFPTKNWGTVYMLTDTKDNIQVLAFKNDTKLVLIQSRAIHPITDWPAYLDALKV